MANDPRLQALLKVEREIERCLERTRRLTECIDRAASLAGDRRDTLSLLAMSLANLQALRTLLLKDLQRDGPAPRPRPVPGSTIGPLSGPTSLADGARGAPAAPWTPGSPAANA